ncbi:hypothetical protein [Kitasatospora sp. NPDC057223]|uniref:hypothetical protein n=1 Tax=Kitasatospora sp. NPDC057223 TaxID=3346055 RepID=UPI003636349B
MTTWHHDLNVDGVPYPLRHPLPARFADGDVAAGDLMELTEEQVLTATAVHELGHAVLWLAGGLRVARISIRPAGRASGHAEMLPTGGGDEARLRAIGTAGGERAEDRWLRKAGLWTPDRAAVVELGACSDRARLLESVSPRPQFGTGGPDFALLHDMADDALDQVWERLTTALPVLLHRQVMSGAQLAACTGLPLPKP